MADREPLIRVSRTERVLAVKPWAASGPGWSNRGVTVFIEDAADGTVRRETVREGDLPSEAIDVTSHAVDRAGERYGCADPLVILADVAAALREGRSGRVAPTGYTSSGRSVRCLWTADESRVYVVRRGGNRFFVITALPAEPKLRKRIRVHISHELHPHGAPTVEQAFHAALTRKRRLA